MFPDSQLDFETNKNKPRNQDRLPVDSMKDRGINTNARMALITTVLPGMLTVLAATVWAYESSLAPAEPAGVATRYEAEAAVLLGSAQTQAVAKASGGYATGGIKHRGDGMIFSKVAGGTALRICYATPDGYANISLYMNNRFVKVLPFKPTESWNDFNIMVFSVKAPAGASLKIVRNDTDGDALLDWVELLGTPADPLPELEPGPLSPPVVVTRSTEAGRTTVSLNGIWQCQEACAADKEKIPGNWQHSIPVPGLSEMARPVIYGNDDSYDYIFCRRQFVVTGNLPPTVRLKINKGWYGKKIWVNGQPAGEHLPNFTPVTFDITRHVLGGGATNTVVIRCGKRYTLPPGSSIGEDNMVRYNYMPGLYDDISLFLSGNHTVEKTRCAPILAGNTLRVSAIIRNRSSAATIPVTLEVHEASSGKLAGTASTNITLEAGTEGEVDISAGIAKAVYWTPENPFLYRFTVRTDDDLLSARTGMRTIGFDPLTRKPMLNGKICMIRGTSIPMYRFFEDSERAGLPWDKEWARKIIRLFKGIHLNTLRFHVGFAPELWYDVCDEEGFLVEDEYPIWSDPDCVKRLTADGLQQEFTDWIFERNHHPSLFIWDTCNEARIPATTTLIQRLRNLDLQNRPWDNGDSRPLEPTDTREKHPYFQYKKPDWTSEAFNTMTLEDQGRSPTNPVNLNEYSWTWLNRDGSPQYGPVAEDYRYYALRAASSSVSDRRRERAMVVAQETEWFRANRHAMVMYFVGLNFSRYSPENLYRSDTSDDLLPGIAPEPRFNPEFQERMQDAFAPVGLMIHYFNRRDTAGAEKTIPVYVMNDLEKTWSGNVTLRIEQNGREVSSMAKSFTNVATGYRACENYGIKFPETPGKYQIVAFYTANGIKVRSIRDVELLPNDRTR